jgi:formylglycine-generating enzyme required for sulfatase activity
MLFLFACGSTQVGFEFSVQSSVSEPGGNILQGEDPQPEDPEDNGDEPSSEDTGGEEEESEEETEETADPVITEDPYCPVNMVSVRDELDEPMFCIDIFEISIEGEEWGNFDQGLDWPDGSTAAVATSVPSVTPAIFFSWYQAVALCGNAGKYLCSIDEWRDGCDGHYGPGGNSFPFGDDWIDGECAARMGGDESVYSGVQPTGSHPGCISDWGTYDQIGNAWEWADPMQVDADGAPVTNKIGASYYSGGGNIRCSSNVVADHPPEFDGEIGARCCATPTYSD